MGRLDGRQAPGGGLALDDETAGRTGFNHETRQAQKGRTLPNDFPGAMPCRVNEKNHESAFTERRGREAETAYAHGVFSWIQQDGVVPGIVDQRANSGVVVKADSRDDLAIGQVQARKSSRCAFLMPELLWVHEKDDPRTRFHRRLRGTEAAGLRTLASVTRFSRHLTSPALSLIPQAASGGSIASGRKELLPPGVTRSAEPPDPPL
jgi:hypothetical protein